MRLVVSLMQVPFLICKRVTVKSLVRERPDKVIIVSKARLSKIYEKLIINRIISFCRTKSR